MKRKDTPADLKARLLSEALVLIKRSGPQALTMREVATRVGVSPMAAYRHFANKDAILAAVAEQGFIRLDTKLKKAAARHLSEPLKALQSLVIEYVRFAKARPHYFALMFGPEIANKDRFPGLKTAAEGAFSTLTSAVQNCITTGALKRKNDPLQVGAAIHSMVHGISSLVLHQRMDRRFPKDKSFDEVISSLFGLLLQGIASQRSGKPTV